MQRIRLAGPLVIVLLAVAACSSDSAATSAAAGSSSPSTTASSAAPTSSEPAGTEIHATGTSGTPTIGEPICDAQQNCMFPLTGPGTFAGDLTGTSIAHSTGALFGTEFAASSTLIFTGTVKGCGTGTMVILSTGTGSTDGRSTNTWNVFEGLGTGDLAKVSGTGTTSFVPGSDGALAATITGRVTC